MAEATVIPIYTIGYGDRSLAEFVALLHHYGIAYLVDVRSAPYSRYKPEFSKDALAQALKAAGIRYIYLGDALGGRPADPECYRDGKVDYAVVKTKPFYQQGIVRIKRAFEQQQQVALMCSEGRPEECHRSKLLGISLAMAGVPVQHIDESGALKSQEDVVNLLTGPQLSLFGESDGPSFTSRKRYRPSRSEADEESPLDDLEPDDDLSSPNP
jgi:uncharacterized protein (DUF488 family)